MSADFLVSGSTRIVRVVLFLYQVLLQAGAALLASGLLLLLSGEFFGLEANRSQVWLWVILLGVGVLCARLIYSAVVAVEVALQAPSEVRLSRLLKLANTALLFGLVMKLVAGVSVGIGVVYNTLNTSSSIMASVMAVVGLAFVGFWLLVKVLEKRGKFVSLSAVS